MEEIRLTQAPILPVGEPAVASQAAGAATGQPQTTFLGTLQEAIAQTNELQFQASEAVNRQVTGGDQSLHQTMVALQKADISFQLMMQVRNKIVTAYEEIQRMQL